MASLDVIRTLTIKARTEGVQQATSDLNKLAQAEQNVATASVQTERATLSVEKAFQRLQRQLDGAVRAQEQVAQARKTLDAAMAQGLVSQQRASDLMQMAIRQFNTGAEVTGKYANSQKLARFELINLSRQLQDVGVSLASGQGLMTVAIQQGSQIADVFSTSGVSLGGFARQVVGMVTPMRLLIGAIGLTTAAIVGMAKVWSAAALQFDNLSKRLDTPIDKLQELQGAAAIKGIDTDEFVKGMEQFGDQVNLAQKGLGDLNDLLRLNGQSVGTVEENFLKVADLVKNAKNEVDKLNILQAAGLPRSQEWVRLMEQGAEGVRKAAEEMGNARIDPQMIQTARDFEEAWNKAWAVFKIEALAAIGDALSGLSSLLTTAGEFIGNITGLLPTGGKTRGDEIDEENRKQQELNETIKDGEDARLKITVNRQTQTLEDIKATEKSLQLERQRITMLGDLASTQDKIRAKEIDIQLARIKGVNISKQEEEALKKNVELGGKAGTQLKELETDYSNIEQAVSNFASTLIHGMVDGMTATEALGRALEGLGSQLISLGTQDFAKSISKSISDLLPSISSAIPGFGGLATAGIGAGISLIGKLFGKGDDQTSRRQEQENRRAAEELKRAQEAWAAMTDELEKFNRAAKGLATGQLTSSIQSLINQADQLGRAARAARDEAGAQAVGNTLVAGIGRLLREFSEDLPAAIRNFGSSTKDAGQDVAALMKQYDELSDSIRELGARTLAYNLAAEKQAELTNKAMQALLGLLDIPTELSEISQSIADLRAKAEALPDALIKLGMSAEEAAAAIDEKLNAALEKLRSNFLGELTRQVNELAGGEWINQAEELARKVAEMRSDAAQLGIETSLIDTFFVLSAQKIVDQNELTGDSFAALARLLGLADTSLHEFNVAIEETVDVIKRSAAEIADAIQSNEDRLFRALHRSQSLQDQLARFDLAAQREREAEIKAGGQALASLDKALAQERLNLIDDYNAQVLEEQRAAQQKAAEEAERARQKQLEEERRQAEERQRILEEATRFLQGALRRISEWIANFLSGPQSPLSPLQRLQQAQSQFASQYSQALSGNREALQGITSVAQDLVDATRAYYGSAPAGQTIIDQMIAQLQALPSLTSPEQFIVDELTPPIEDISTTVSDSITTQTSTLQNQLQTLQTAVQAGDAQAVAAALQPFFNTLDINTDGLLTFSEFQSGLSGMASDSALRDMFTRLDTDNSGGISRLELINQSLGGSGLSPGNAVPNTAASTAAINTTTATELPSTDINTQNAAQQLVTSNATLDSIKTSTLLLTEVSTATQAIAANTGNASGAMLNLLSTINAYASELPAIRASTGAIAAWAPGSNHAMGGLLTGPRHSQGGIPLGGGHWAEGGEYIMSRNAVQRVGVGTLNAMNFGGQGTPANDNMFTLMRGLERNLMRGIKALIDTQLEAAGIIARPIEEQNKLQRARRGEKQKTAA